MAKAEIFDSQLEKNESSQNKKETSSEDMEKRISKSRTKIDLNDLKNLVESSLIDKKLAKDIAKDKKITEQEYSDIISTVDIKKVIEWLQTIENIPDINALLPKEYRINLQEYHDSLKDPIKKQVLLVKIDQTFDFMHNQNHPLDKLIIKKFSLFTWLLHKRLEQEQLDVIHDCYIDTKNTLLS